LKPENLLLDKESENPRVTIIDFGTSGVFDPHKKMNQKYGTPYYIAPEVLKKNYD
jgi:calcium-dependent protein kinase